jgi:hypothetical protein
MPVGCIRNVLTRFISVGTDAVCRRAYRNRSSNVLHREIGSVARCSVWKRQGYFSLLFPTMFGIIGAAVLCSLHGINKIKRIFRFWNCWTDFDYVWYKLIYAWTGNFIFVCTVWPGDSTRWLPWGVTGGSSDNRFQFRERRRWVTRVYHLNGGTVFMLKNMYL